jgi:hypothetical protein
VQPASNLGKAPRQVKYRRVAGQAEDNGATLYGQVSKSRVDGATDAHSNSGNQLERWIVVVALATISLCCMMSVLSHHAPDWFGASGASIRFRDSVEVVGVDTEATNCTDFDFQTHVSNDRIKKKCRWWKWLSQKECASFGVVIDPEAQAKLFKGYKKVQVDANREAVLALLEAHGLQAAEMHNQLEDLVWRLVLQEAYFLASEDSTAIVLMSVVSRLYLSQGDRLLMQKGTSSASTEQPTKNSFLDVKKMPSETSLEAAHRFWAYDLKMPSDVASFFEDEVIYEDTDSFKCLRMVLRVHKVYVRIERTDAPELERIGLPEFGSFTAGADTDLELIWQTAEECVELGMEGHEIEDAFACPERWTLKTIKKKDELFSDRSGHGHEALGQW